MKTWDRLLRSLFVALAVGTAWSIRGDFGLAIFPGALLGMGYRGMGWTEEDLERFRGLLEKGFDGQIEEDNVVG